MITPVELGSVEYNEVKNIEGNKEAVIEKAAELNVLNSLKTINSVSHG